MEVNVNSNRVLLRYTQPTPATVKISAVILPSLRLGKPTELNYLSLWFTLSSTRSVLSLNFEFDFINWFIEVKPAPARAR